MNRRLKDYKNVYCHKCGSPNTSFKRSGRPIWYFWKLIENILHYVICSKCYWHYIGHPRTYKREKARGTHIRIGKNRQKVLEKHKPKKALKNSECVLVVNGKSYWFKFPIRCGVCTWCRAVKGIDTKYTQLHHDEDRYDYTNILKYTIELCVECHAKETRRLNKH